MSSKLTRFLSIEVEPDGAPTVERSEEGYWIQWDHPGLAVMLSEENLRALVAEAMIAQATTGAA